MKNELSKASVARLGTCSESIVKVIKDVVKNSPINLDVVVGAITADELKGMYKRKLTPYNPDNFIEKNLKTKIKYKKELYAKVPNLIEKKADKASAFSINCPGGNNDKLNMVIGLILGTANRMLKKETLVFKGIVREMASFELISK